MAEDAIGDELCEFNPWIGVKVRDDDRRAMKHSRELRVWTFDEMHSFAADAGRFQPMIRALADCGLRIGELFAVERANLGDGVLRVRGTAWEGRVLETSREKNHRRDVPVPPGLQALLREMAVRIDSPLLFPRRRASCGGTRTGIVACGSRRSRGPGSIRRRTSSGTPG